MSIPSTKPHLSQPPMTISPRMSGGHVEKFDKSGNQIQSQNGTVIITGTLSKKALKQQLMASSHNARRKCSLSKAVDRESVEDKEGEENANAGQQQTFRSRSKTISDTSG